VLQTSHNALLNLPSPLVPSLSNTVHHRFNTPTLSLSTTLQAISNRASTTRLRTTTHNIFPRLRPPVGPPFLRPHCQPGISLLLLPHLRPNRPTPTTSQTV
jgi:hypothetical protein